MDFIKNILKKIKRERNLIGKFREAGAYTYNLAVDPKDIVDINISVFNRLIRRGVFERAVGNTFFLNERALMKYRMEKSKWGMIILMFVLGIIILFIK